MELGCIEHGPMPHTNYVYFKSIPKNNTLNKFDRN